MATAMKIGEETEAYATADFEFPNNPRLVDSQFVPNRMFKTVPFGKMHIASDFGGGDPRSIVLNGTLPGTTKRDDYNNLAHHINDSKIKKFFISDDRFYYFLGQNIKETLSGDRTNFIDYVATLWTPIPYAYDDTAKTYTVTGLTGTGTTILNDATTNSTGKFENAGNAPSFVKWTLINQLSGQDITKIEIGDSSTIAGSTRLITWTGTLPTAGAEALRTLTIYMIKFVTQTGGSKFLKYGYSEINSAQSGNVQLKGNITGLPYVSPAATDQGFCIRINTGGAFTGTLNLTATWNPAYLG